MLGRIRRRCYRCGGTFQHKLASAYWAWFNAEGERSAWSMKYCPECAVAIFSGLLNDSPAADQESEVFACVSCGTDCSQDSDPIFCTLFLPGQPAMELSLQLDGACAANYRGPIVTNGDRLANRDGHSPRTARVDPWAAIGILPREAA